MTADIVEIVFPEDKDKTPPELTCSFCGVPKSKAFGKFLVDGLDARICVACVRLIRSTLNPEPDEPDGAA